MTVYGPPLTCTTVEGPSFQGCELAEDSTGYISAANEPRPIHSGQCLSATFDADVTDGAVTVLPFAGDGVGIHFIIGQAIPLPTQASWSCRVGKDVTLDTFGFLLKPVANGPAFDVTSATFDITSTEDCATLVAGGVTDCGFPPANCKDTGYVDFEGDLAGWTIFPPPGPDSPSVSEVPGWSDCNATRLVQTDVIGGEDGWSMTAPVGVARPQGGKCIAPRIRARGGAVTLLTTSDNGELRVEFDLDVDERWTDDFGAIQADGQEEPVSNCRVPDGFLATGVTLATGEAACDFLDIDRVTFGIYNCEETVDETEPDCEVTR